MIFHDFIYEFWYEFFARTLLGTPEFIIFHEIMQDIMDSGLLSWERSYQKSYLNVVKNVVKWWKICMNSSGSLNLIESIGAVRWPAVSDRARPFCHCCSRATCLTVGLSIWQSYSANTCHLGLITHSVLAASVSPTWISAASLCS